MQSYIFQKAVISQLCLIFLTDLVLNISKQIDCKFCFIATFAL